MEDKTSAEARTQWITCFGDIELISERERRQKAFLHKSCSRSTRQQQEYILHFSPYFRVRIDNLKVIGVLHGNELHVLTRFLFLFRVPLADFVRDVFIGCAVNEKLLCANVLLRR